MTLATIARADRVRRAFAAAGALMCALAIALAAVAAHAASDIARERLEPAALYLLVHGLALAILAPRQSLRLEWLALLAWLAGSALFSGTLVLSVATGVSAALAPAGGTLLIVGWLLQALAMLQRTTTARQGHPGQPPE